MLNDKEAEYLVEMIDKNQNTYKDIKKHFPQLSSTDLIDYIEDDFLNTNPVNTLLYEIQNKTHTPLDCPKLLKFKVVPSDFWNYGYQFKDTDTFSLTVIGENMLYKTQIRIYQRKLGEKSTNWAKWGTILTLIGLICQLLADEAVKEQCLMLIKSFLSK